MVIIKGFITAIINSFKAISFIFSNKLSVYYFYAFCLWLLIWGLSILGLTTLAKSISNIINERIAFNNIPDVGSWLSFFKPFLGGYFTVIISFFIKIILWFVSSIFIKYVVLIILSPLFSLLSEVTDERLNNTKFPFTVQQLIKDVFRGIVISLRNMFLEYLIVIICFLVTLLFAPLGIITAPILIISSWYFVGYTMLDYNFERHKMTMRESNLFTNQNFGLTCGIGLVYSFFLILPFNFGVIFGSVITVVAATLCFVQIKKNNTTTISIL